MKRVVFLILVLFVAGCAHNPSGYSPAPAAVSSPSPLPVVVSGADPLPLKSPEGSDALARKNPDDQKKLPALKPVDPPEPLKSSPREAVNDEKKTPGDNNPPEEEVSEKEVTIADPLEPFNRAMFHFNDKLYFWVFKPLAQGYKKVVPEPARKGVDNFFTHLGFPVRFISRLLQARLQGCGHGIRAFCGKHPVGGRGFFGPFFKPATEYPQKFRGSRSNLGGLWTGTGLLYRLAVHRTFQRPGFDRPGRGLFPGPYQLYLSLVYLDCGQGIRRGELYLLVDRGL